MNKPKLERNSPVAILAVDTSRAWIGRRHAVVPLHDVALTAVSLRDILARRNHLWGRHWRRRHARAETSRICVVLVVVVMHGHNLLDNGRRATMLDVFIVIVMHVVACRHEDDAADEAEDKTDDDRGCRAHIRVHSRSGSVIRAGRIVIASTADVHIRTAPIGGGPISRRVGCWPVRRRGRCVARRGAPVSGR